MGVDGGMKLSIQLKLSAAWAAAGATLSLAISFHKKKLFVTGKNFIPQLEISCHS